MLDKPNCFFNYPHFFEVHRLPKFQNSDLPLRLCSNHVKDIVLSAARAFPH